MAEPIQSGHLCYVEYQGFPGVVHTRLAIERVHDDHWVIATPDGDLYVEQLSRDNGDFTRFWHVTDGGLPGRVPRDQIYAFQPMTAQQYARLLSRGQTLGRAERQRLGHAASAPVAAPAAPLPDDGLAEEDMVWILAEMVPGHKIGEEVSVPAGAARDGDHALVHVTSQDGCELVVRASRVKKDDLGSSCEDLIGRCRLAESLHGEDVEAAADVRTLSIKYNINGERHRGFKSSIDDMRMVEFDDFPLEPRTACEYLRAVSDVAESCYGQHLAWVQTSKIPDGDRAIWENETLSRAIDLGIRYDCLNVVNLASFELLIRRKQLIAEAHVQSPAAPSYEGSDYFMCVKFRPGGGIVVPSLTEYVAKRMHEDSQVMKEKRKLKEAKDAKGQGKNKGNPQPSNPPKPEGAGGGKK